MRNGFGKRIATLLFVAAAMISGPGAATEPAPLHVEYDAEALPEPVRRMWDAIREAAMTGDIDEMLPVLESNELPPLISRKPVSGPIAHWRKISSDGKGHDVLAAMLDALEAGYVRVKQTGSDPVYVWPYFAEVPLKTLTPSQLVELHRVVSPEQIATMRKAGRYTHYRIGIGTDGTWHYFLRDD